MVFCNQPDIDDNLYWTITRKHHVTCDLVIYETQRGKPVYPLPRHLFELISRFCVNLFTAHQICAHLFHVNWFAAHFLTPKLKLFCYAISIVTNLVLLFSSLTILFFHVVLSRIISHLNSNTHLNSNKHNLTSQFKHLITPLSIQTWRSTMLFLPSTLGTIQINFRTWTMTLPMKMVSQTKNPKWLRGRPQQRGRKWKTLTLPVLKNRRREEGLKM